MRRAPGQALGLVLLLATSGWGGDLVLSRARVRTSDGTTATRTVRISGGLVETIDSSRPDGALDLSGSTLLPAFIDAHVHVTLAEPAAILEGGVGAVIDFGAPSVIWELAPRLRPLRVFPAGPLLTAPGGYPTRSLWGRDGYGLELRGVEEVRQAVRRLKSQGARVIKVAIAPSAGPVLTLAELRAIVAEAHAVGLKVGAHAISLPAVDRALASGVDLLVHAPVERIDQRTVERFCGRPDAAVVPTLRAFGDGPRARDNVKRMREAGCTILYGTDLPNNVRPGIDVAELRAFVEIGMTPSQAIAAATEVPAAYFGLEGLGRIEPESAGSLIAVRGDPYTELERLESLWLVIAEGEVIVDPSPGGLSR